MFLVCIVVGQGLQSSVQKPSPDLVMCGAIREHVLSIVDSLSRVYWGRATGPTVFTLYVVFMEEFLTETPCIHGGVDP